MVEAFARWMTDRQVAIAWVALTALLGIVGGIWGSAVEQDDDVLAFLPRTNPDIRAFYDISEVFGGLDVALVGIETEDVFAPEFLEPLAELTDRLGETPGLDHVASLTNTEDITTDPIAGGIITAAVVDRIPHTPEERRALREKVLSRDHVVGTLVSEDGQAVLVYGFLAHGSAPREVAGRMKKTVAEVFPKNKVYWGGAPFISTWVFDATQEDMRRLTPWAVITIVVIMLVSFRDLLGATLGLLATAVGIGVSRAAMAVLGVSFNIVLSAMPVILFAVGSAYSIHVLSHYTRHARDHAPEEAVRRTLVGTGPTVLAAGLTTVAGLLSFVTMDIEPMRTFGVYTALGLTVSLVLSLTFVPAVLMLAGLKGRPEGRSMAGEATVALVRGARASRAVVGLLLAVVAVGAAVLIGGVDTRMDDAAFFSEGSPPAEAEAFLNSRFGGSQFVQVRLVGDLTDPEVVREVQRVGDRLAEVPEVSGVVSVARVVGLANEAMSGARRVPDTGPQLGVLYGFLASNPAVRQLIARDRDQALMQVKLADSRVDAVEQALEHIQAVLDEAPTRVARASTGGPDAGAARKRRDETIALRAAALAEEAGIPPDPARRQEVLGWLAQPLPAPSPEAVAEALARFLASEECFVELDPSQAEAVAVAVVPLGAQADSDAVVAAATEALALPEDDGTAMDLGLVLDGPLEAIWREAGTDAAAHRLVADLGWAVPAGERGERLYDGLSGALMDLYLAEVLVPSEDPDALSLRWEANGQPVLYRGLSRSVAHNQITSLAMALGLVFLIMTALYRSPATGLLATMPTVLTLMLVYGGMGWLGVHLDIGTSMLASIIIGAGVDYSVHLLASWEGDDVDAAMVTAVDDTAHAIWTNALMVAAGFFVLTLGDARPLQNVGGLTAAAMVTAAVATFVVIPVLARRTRYRVG